MQHWFQDRKYAVQHIGVRTGGPQFLKGFFRQRLHDTTAHSLLIHNVAALIISLNELTLQKEMGVEHL
jgi:hypothetical protein